MPKIICVIILTSFTFFSRGQSAPDKDKERIDAVCNKFMENFLEENISAAMQLLKQNSVIFHSNIDTLQETINYQMQDIFPTYGKMLFYEFITERKIKNIIAKRFYILKLEKYYLKFDFTLYNTGKSWTITNFHYNDDLTEVLD